MSDVKIQVVDENDQIIGAVYVQEAWKKGLRHRIARVMAFDKNGNVLLQKRNSNKFLYPDCWDPSAAGHVDESDSYELAASRELEEEMGISNVSLTEIAYYHTESKYQGKLLNRFIKLYKTVVPHNIKIKIQEEEVEEAKWFSPSELKSLVLNNPNEVADGLLESYEKIFK